MKFYVSRGALIVKDGNEKDTLIVARFMQSDNQAKAGNYLRSVAEKLNTMEPFSNEMSKYLESVESKVGEQMLAEKFMEEVAF